jgi:hypothetical protein
MPFEHVKEVQMDDKKLYRQKKQAQLDEWNAQMEVLKAKSSGSSADLQIEMNKQIHQLDSKLDEGKRKLVELDEVDRDAWDSVKDGVENAWDSMKTAMSDVRNKFS